MSIRRTVFAATVLAVLSLVAPTAVVSASAASGPGTGPTFNSAFGGPATRQKINNKILGAIRSTPRGETIRIMTWNYESPAATDALLAAQRRKVRVQVIIARGNARGNPSFTRLRTGLKNGNWKSRPTSWARSCSQSCRGRGGAAHAKFYLFSKSGSAKNVVIQGSANLTQAAANNQWNDIVTTHRAGPYKFFTRIFNQMSKDKPVKATYASQTFGTDRFAFFPGGRTAKNDPVLQLLNSVRCRGASNTKSGRTQLRILPDVVRGDRGMKLARKVKSLYANGCDIRMGYTVMGIDIGRMLSQPTRRGRVPLIHMVRDANGDRQFDQYFHMKAMTVIGNAGGKSNTRKVLNGAANWSDDSAKSDENFGIYNRPEMVGRYREHADYWMNRLRGANRAAASEMTARRSDVESGRVTPDGLIFGTGPVDGVDVFANLEQD
jgi:hypothetical protein